MVGKLARGAFLLLVALMVAAYVLSAVNAKPSEPSGIEFVQVLWC
jgi:hypothetical protein